MYSFLFVLTTKAERVPVLYIQFFLSAVGPTSQAKPCNFRKPILPALSTCVWSFLFLLSVSSQYVSFAACPFLAMKFRNSSFLGRLADLGDYFKGFNELSVDFFLMFEKRLMYVKNQKQHIFSVDFLILKGGLWQRLNKSFRVSKQKNRWRYLKP